MKYIRKFRCYLDENEGWKQSLSLQQDEIPWMEMLLNTVRENESLNHPQLREGEDHFFSQLSRQQVQLNQLNADLITQQERLDLDCKTEVEDIDAYCVQDLLRERIRTVERAYLELKCNFMGYLSAIL